MNRTDALSYSTELLEAAADGDWGSLLQLGLGADLLEHLRQLQQINVEITKLEAREKQMNDAFIGRLQLMEFDDPATDGGDRPAPSAAKPQQQTPPKPAGGNLMDLAVPT